MTCAFPIGSRDRVVLGHGSGGRLSADLLREVFLPALGNPTLNRLEDQAVCEAGAARLALTTDSFVVKPLEFRGGDIGSLSVHGTVNDLAVGGARPLWLSAAFILEEGLPFDVLRRVVESMARAATAAGVAVVTGDTKVVPRGAADGMFITTSGVGLMRDGVCLSAAAAQPGDIVLLSGSIGDHGIAIMAEREGLEFECPVASDSAPLNGLVERMLGASTAIHAMRDPTRGGVSSSLNEIAQQSGVSIRIRERDIPVKEAVRGACEILGFDPLYVANEGKLLAIVAPDAADAVLAAMRAHELGRNAAAIGEVIAGKSGQVVLETTLGTSRVVDLLSGDQLPRIC